MGIKRQGLIRRGAINLKKARGLRLRNLRLYYIANQLHHMLDIISYSYKVYCLSMEIQELEMNPINIIFIQDNKNIAKI